MFCFSLTVSEALIKYTRLANVEALTFAVFTLLTLPLQPKQTELPPQTRETHSNGNTGLSHLADTNRILTSLVRRLVGS